MDLNLHTFTSISPIAGKTSPELYMTTMVELQSLYKIASLKSTSSLKFVCSVWKIVHIFEKNLFF